MGDEETQTAELIPNGDPVVCVILGHDWKVIFGGTAWWGITTQCQRCGEGQAREE